MSKCPYIHKNKVELENQYNDQIILVCEFCSNIFFRCPKCKETNRSLAIFCRSCSQGISFNEAENDLTLNLSNYEEKTTLFLPNGSGRILNLTTYFGYILITTENKCFISNMTQILNELDLFGETLQGSCFNSNENKVELFITTNKKIYSINLLNFDKPADILHEVSDSVTIFHEALASTDIYWLERAKNSSVTKLCSLKKGDIKSYSCGIRPLIKISENKIFITTDDKLELYDSQSGSFLDVTLTNGIKNDTINLGCQPGFNEQKNTVYIFGEKNLWRIDLDKNELKAYPLQMQSTGDECMAISKDGHILVSRSDGFYILNSFGTVDWQADSIYIPEASNFDGKIPQISGQYCIFSGLTGNGNVFRVYMLSNPNRYSEKISLSSLLNCSPLLSFGHLFIPVDRGKEQSLKIYKLKELN